MFDDYVLYLLESLHCQERANELMRAMKGEGSTGEPALPWALPSCRVICTLPSVPCVSLALCPQECSYGEQVKWCETKRIPLFVEWA